MEIKAEVEFYAGIVTIVGSFISALFFFARKICNDKLLKWKNRLAGEVEKVYLWHEGNQTVSAFNNDVEIGSYNELLSILEKKQLHRYNQRYSQQDFKKFLEGLDCASLRKDIEVQRRLFEWCSSPYKDVPNPSLDIVARRDRKSLAYMPENRRRLALVVAHRIYEWICHYKQRHVEEYGGCDAGGKTFRVLVLGLNEKNLIKMVFVNLREMTDCYFHIWFHPEVGMNDADIKDFFNFDDNMDNRNHVIVQDALTQPNSYDIIIHAHWFQHNSMDKFDQEFKNGNVLESGGLLVWLSALSRSSSTEEFVCEGWMPRKPVITTSSCPGAVRFVNLNVENADSFIMYQDLTLFGGKNHDLLRVEMQNTFPRCPFTFQIAEFRDVAGLVERVKACLGKINVDLNRLDVKVEQVIDVPSEKQGIISPRYYVVCVTYTNAKGEGTSTNFIVAYGAEEYVFDANQKKLHYLTFFPAAPLRLAYSDGDLRNLDVIRQHVVKVNDENCLDPRYWRDDNNKPINDRPIVETQFSSLWTVFTSLKDVDLLDYLICAFHVNKDLILYYTVLPKKQFLSRQEFLDRLAVITSFDVKIRQTTELPQYVQWRTVTHLETYKTLKDKLQNIGLYIEADKSVKIPLSGCIEIDVCTPYFHKCYGTMKKGCTSIENEDNYDVSVGKDLKFNKSMKLDERVKCLRQMAAHDVLFFAIKS